MHLHFLCCPFEENAINRDRFVCPSSVVPLTSIWWCQTLQVKITFAGVMPLFVNFFVNFYVILTKHPIFLGRHKCLAKRPSSFLKQITLCIKSIIFSFCFRYFFISFSAHVHINRVKFQWFLLFKVHINTHV